MFLRRFARSLAAATLAATLLPVGPVSAATITVCAIGCDYSSIGDAIVAASDGDTIEVGAGTYVENGLTIDKSLTIRGVAPVPAVSDPEDLLTPGVLRTVVQTGGPGNGPTFTLTSPAAGPSPVIRFEDLAIVGNDDFDTIRIASNDPVWIQSVAVDGVALAGSRTAINTVGLRPIHGLQVTNSAVTCTGASNPTGGILLGVADGVGDTIAVTGNYMAQCGWPINAGNHAGFGTLSNVAGAVTISGNRMEENRFGCVLIAMSYADLTISNNTFTNCDLQPGSANGAVDIQGLAPTTNVKVLGNEITRAGVTTAGNVGVIVQNIPASAGNLAQITVEGNWIHGISAGAASAGIRLGPTVIARAAADVDIDIVGNYLTGNTRGFDWQTNAGTTIEANLDVHRNRFAGNVARAISLFGPSRTLDAENNWFGCNAGPAVAPCDSIGVNTPATASVDFSPWLVLSVTASPTEIGPGGETSTIAASLSTNSDGNPVANPIPDGTSIAFATDLGSVAPAADDTLAGVAGTTLTSDASTGVANVTATLDAQVVTALVTIDCSTVCYVDNTTGNDANSGATAADAKKTIQAAIDTVDENGTVIVAAGTYVENLSITQGLRLQGVDPGVVPDPADLLLAGSLTTVLQAATAAGPAINVTGDFDMLEIANIRAIGVDSTGAGTMRLGLGATSSDLLLDTVAFDGANRSIYTAGGYPVNGVTIRDSAFRTAAATASVLELWFAASDLTVTDNYVTGGRDGMNLSNGLGADLPLPVGGTSTVDGNEIDGYGDSGIQVAVSFADLTVSNNVIRGPASEGGVGEGIQVESSAHATKIRVTGNTIDGGDDGLVISGLTASSVDIVADHNVITDQAGAGVIARSGSAANIGALIIERNSITGNALGASNAVAVSTLDAECNWWGSATGPGPVGPGTGDGVTAGLDFSPWLQDSNLVTALCRLPLSLVSTGSFLVDEGEVIPAGTGVGVFSNSNTGDTYLPRICWTYNSLPADPNCISFSGAGVVSVGGDEYEVRSPAPFAYADDGTYDIAVDLTIFDADDNDAGTFGWFSEAIVSNVDPVVTAGAHQDADEGEDHSFDLGSFSDPGVDDDPWDVVVDWGDGSTETTFSTNSQGPFGSKNHTYADNGPYTVEVCVTDKDGGDHCATFTATVANVAPTAVLRTTSSDEGSPFGLRVTDPFDPSADDTSAGFQYRFDCGFGAGLTAWSTNRGVSCPTTANGIRSVTAQIRDKDGEISTYADSVTISNVDPDVTLSGPAAADEGHLKSYSYSTVDPGDEVFLHSPSCGANGSISNAVANPDGSGTFDCTFPDGDLPSTVSIGIDDQGGGTDSDSIAVTISNVDPDVTASALTSGGTTTLTSSFSDPGVDDNPWGVVIDWGDGSLDTAYGTANQGAQPNQAHVYASPGTYTITVSVTDKDAGAGTAEVLVVIGAQAVKTGVLAQIQAEIGDWDNDTNKHLQKAADALTKSLAADLWQGGPLTPKKGKKVFDEERKAADELGKIKAPALAASVEAWIYSLVAADRAIAQGTLELGGWPAKDADKAQKEIDKGDEYADNKPEKAIEHYRNAWDALLG